MGWRVLQEAICSPEDILEEREVQVACTVHALNAHATPHSPKDIAQPYYPLTVDVYEEDYETVELNYQKQLRRYSDERFIGNFNFGNYGKNVIDESEEYQNYENNNAEESEHSSSQYADIELRNRGSYYQTNRVQFVTPFCKDPLQKTEYSEIYDTDEVDHSAVISERDISDRYDRGKMNLEIQNNLNTQLTIETDAALKEEKERLFYTCLCLGTFFLSAIVLILYPL